MKGENVARDTIGAKKYDTIQGVTAEINNLLFLDGILHPKYFAGKGVSSTARSNELVFHSGIKPFQKFSNQMSIRGWTEDMDREEKIKDLQIMNKRRLLLRKMQIYIKEIEIDNFISLNKTKELQTNAFNIMEKLDATCGSIIKPLDSTYIDLYIENIQSFSKYMNEKIVFYHRQSMSIGAVEIHVNAVLNNINYIISESEIYEKGCRIFLVNKDARFGLCLWKGEYDIRLYKWEEI